MMYAKTTGLISVLLWYDIWAAGANCEDQLHMLLVLLTILLYADKKI